MARWADEVQPFGSRQLQEVREFVVEHGEWDLDEAVSGTQSVLQVRVIAVTGTRIV